MLPWSCPPISPGQGLGGVAGAGICGVLSRTLFPAVQLGQHSPGKSTQVAEAQAPWWTRVLRELRQLRDNGEWGGGEEHRLAMIVVGAVGQAPDLALGGQRIVWG